MSDFFTFSPLGTDMICLSELKRVLCAWKHICFSPKTRRSIQTSTYIFCWAQWKWQCWAGGTPCWEAWGPFIWDAAFWPNSVINLWTPGSFSLFTPFLPEMVFAFPFWVQGFSFVLTSVLHHFCTEVSLRLLASRALLAIFGVNVCAADVELRTDVKPSIPNRTAGGRVGKGCGNAPCIQAPLHPHTSCGRLFVWVGRRCAHLHP